MKNLKKTYSKTAEGIHGIGFDSIRLMKGVTFFDKFYQFIN